MDPLMQMLLDKLGLPAAVAAVLVVIWVQLKPALFDLLRKRAQAIETEEWRKLAVALVRAAEQIFGESSDKNDVKRDFVKRELGKVVPLDQYPLDNLVATAVHEVKAPLKAQTVGSAMVVESFVKSMDFISGATELKAETLSEEVKDGV